MNKRIETHVNALFAYTSSDSHVLDIKEELLANLNEKYDDLIVSGKNETEAYALVISSIGDIDNLLKDMGQSTTYMPLEIERNTNKRSVFISIGVALYILSIIPLIWFSQFGIAEYGLILLILICAIASGFVAFGNSISKSKYTRANNTFVEEYKEMVSINNEKNKLKGALSSSMWSLVVVLYFLLSFFTTWWHISWIIFIIGALAQLVILYGFADHLEKKRLWHGILWVATVIVYFIISFSINAWAWSWTIFLMAVAIEQIVRLFLIWKNAE
jgi:MFS family permease